MNTTKPQSDQSLIDLLGLTEVPEQEQFQFLGRMGKAVLEAAILRYVSELDEHGVTLLDDVIREHGENPDKLLLHLIEKSPRFVECFEAEADAYRARVARVMGDSL